MDCAAGTVSAIDISGHFSRQSTAKLTPLPAIAVRGILCLQLLPLEAQPVQTGLLRRGRAEIPQIPPRHGGQRRAVIAGRKSQRVGFGPRGVTRLSSGSRPGFAARGRCCRRGSGGGGRCWPAAIGGDIGGDIDCNGGSFHDLCLVFVAAFIDSR